MYTNQIEIKSILAIIATILIFVAYVPYIRDTIKGTTRPHIFTYFLWVLTTGIIFFLQLKNGGGAGAWVTLAIAAVLLVVLLLSFKNGKRDIRRVDYFILFLGLATIPIWLVAMGASFSLIGVIYILSRRKYIKKPAYSISK